MAVSRDVPAGDPILGIAKALEVVEEMRPRSLAPELADDLSSLLLLLLEHQVSRQLRDAGLWDLAQPIIEARGPGDRQRELLNAISHRRGALSATAG